jgi:hypothetical protein
MHRSSESIAALAAALAKAQSELSNPEKSLVGTIGADRPGEAARTFRYAPLSSGLDLIRKALGQQQIATVQTTAIDTSSGIINLTTVLAHASGEWIASDWPVCRLADTASPHRMGAALTYARRYALFTLVGIAGEDDLDAPDLNGRPQVLVADNGRTVSETANPRRSDRNGKGVRQPMLDAESSAALRDRFVHEIACLGSTEQAALWARSALPAKNTLTASDARLVQVAFELALSALDGNAERLHGEGELRSSPAAGMETGGTEACAHPAPATEPPSPDPEPVTRHSGGGSSGGIDKSVLSIPEPRRYRDKAHLKFVASQSCLICGRRPCDPHHLRFAQVRALGRKVSDEFTVPLCRTHHRELHRTGNEAGWWAKVGIDAVGIARKLWNETRSAGFPAPSANVQPPATETMRQALRRKPERAAEPEEGPRPERPTPPRIAHDLAPTDRGEPPQCAQEHRAHERQRKARLAPECVAPRVHGRDRARSSGKPQRISDLRGRDSLGVPTPNTGRAGTRPSAGLALLAASPGNFD